MVSDDTTDRGGPWAPREATPITAAQLDLDQREALFSMQRAFAHILADIGPLAGARPAAPPPRLPSARPDPRRTSRLMLIDGGRGSGKTSLLLTLLSAWGGARGGEGAVPAEGTLEQGILEAEPPSEARPRWFDAAVARRVWALPPLDFDPMPNGLPLVAWVLQALQAVVLALGDEPCAAGTLNERGRAEQRGLSLREHWHRLHDDAVLAWEDSGEGTSFQARAEQDRQRLRSWSGFEDRFTKAMDELFGAIQAQAEHLDAHFDLLVLPIDDIDMQVSRSPELLHALRLLRHERLVFLCTGDKALLQQTAQAKAKGELATLANRVQQGEGPVDEIGARVVQKMFPAVHTWHRPPFGLREGLRRLVAGAPSGARRWTGWATALEAVVAEVVSPSTGRLWRMNYRDLADLAAGLSRAAPPAAAEDPRGLHAQQVVAHLFAHLLLYHPGLRAEARAHLHEPADLREALMTRAFGAERVVDLTAAVEHTLRGPGDDGALRLGLEFRRRLPLLEAEHHPLGELLLAWSRLIHRAGPDVTFVRSPPLVEVGMGQGTPTPVRGRSTLPGVGPDRWVGWPMSAALRAELGDEGRFTGLVAALSSPLDAGRPPLAALPGPHGAHTEAHTEAEAHQLTCAWLRAHCAAEAAAGGAPLDADPAPPEAARRLAELIGRADPARHVACALVHPMFGLSRALRGQLLSATLGPSCAEAALDQLRDDLSGAGPVTQLIGDAARRSGADAEGTLDQLPVAAQGAEPWWRLQLLARWGAGAWAVHRLGRPSPHGPAEDISPYFVPGAAERSLRAFFRGMGAGFGRATSASATVFSPGPELGLLALQAEGAEAAAEWDRLLWSPTRPVSAARWIVEAWQRSARTERRPEWQGLVTASSDGQSLAYAGPAVALGWAAEDPEGLNCRWVARTVAPGALAPLPAGSPMPGLLGIVMDLTRGGAAPGAAPPIRLAEALVPAGGDLLHRIGCPRVPSFLRAERLRAWRPQLMRGWEDRRAAWPSDEVQVLAAARWIDMVCCALVEVEGAVPTTAPSAEPTVAALLHTLAPRLALGPRASAEERRCGLWMRRAYAQLRGHTSPGLLAQWQAVIDGGMEGMEGTAGTAGPTADRAA